MYFWLSKRQPFQHPHRGFGEDPTAQPASPFHPLAVCRIGQPTPGLEEGKTTPQNSRKGRKNREIGNPTRHRPPALRPPDGALRVGQDGRRFSEEGQPARVEEDTQGEQNPPERPNRPPRKTRPKQSGKPGDKRKATSGCLTLSESPRPDHHPAGLTSKNNLCEPQEPRFSETDGKSPWINTKRPFGRTTRPKVSSGKNPAAHRGLSQRVTAKGSSKRNRQLTLTMEMPSKSNRSLRFVPKPPRKGGDGR